MSRIKQPPHKPVQKRGYTPEDHEGKLYRVRDKDYGDGNPKIWGENLAFDAAQKLHQRVTGSRKSRTARIEEMSTALPGADPTLEAARQKGLAAGRSAAANANDRHAQMMAQRKAQEAAAASAPRPKLTPTLGGKATGRHHAQPVKPQPPKLDLDDTDLEAPDVEDEEEIADEKGADNELGAVKQQAEDDINEYEARGKELYDAYNSIAPTTPPAKPWPQLASKDQAAWSFEAAAQQGPHVAAVLAALGGQTDEEISDESAPPPEAADTGTTPTT
jgi:hypothetical protein